MRLLAYWLDAEPFSPGAVAASRWRFERIHGLAHDGHVRRYHQHYHSSGHIWQGRFLDFPIEEDEHLLIGSGRYVERNALCANLVRCARRLAVVECWAAKRRVGRRSPRRRCVAPLIGLDLSTSRKPTRRSNCLRDAPDAAGHFAPPLGKRTPLLGWASSEPAVRAGVLRRMPRSKRRCLTRRKSRRNFYGVPFLCPRDTHRMQLMLE